jgi:hypothetical protein
MSFTDTELAAQYKADKVFRSYVDRYKPRVPGADLRRCPPLPELKMLEATFFDNGEPEKKEAGRSKARYVLQFKGWTRTQDLDLMVGDWKLNVRLNDRQTFIDLVAKQLLRKSIGQEYHDDLVHLTGLFCDDEIHYFGQFNHNDGGQHYFDRQYCFLKIEEGMPSEILVVNGDMNGGLNASEGWAKTDFVGNLLKYPIKSQMRWDISGDYTAIMPDWATN